MEHDWLNPLFANCQRRLRESALPVTFDNMQLGGASATVWHVHVEIKSSRPFLQIEIPHLDDIFGRVLSE